MSEPIYVVYDGECPFCTAYVKLLRLREAAGKVELVNAREADHPIVLKVRDRGIVLDEEMALMLELEQSYKASSKLVSTVDEMIQALLAAVK